MNTKDINNYTLSGNSSVRMPVLFIGHGSPMNGIDDNEFSNKWVQLGAEIPQPTAILCISAHWLTHGTYVTAMANPKTIHDFGGFPKPLFDVQYPASGNPLLASEIKKIAQPTDIGLDHEWGLDHGTWTVVRHMYPNANIPVLQLSIDFDKPAPYHYDLAKELAGLRNRGILIIGSGNMVHNLRMLSWDKMDVPGGFGFDWALEINEQFKKLILSGNHKELIHFENLGSSSKLAIPTPDHYYPLIYALALQDNKDSIEIFNDKAVAGSLTMTSVKFNA